MARLLRIFLVVLCSGTLSAVSLYCGHDSSSTNNLLLLGTAGQRSFRMGFSPWLYEATVEAQNWTYSRINAEGDVVSNHLEEGVPWPEAYNGTAFSVSYQNEIRSRLDRLVPGKKILVQINPINIGRNGLAAYRGNGVNDPLPAPWNGYALNDDHVKQAFLNYASRMVQYFNPDYLLLGVEVNLLIRNNPSIWSAYVELQRYVYTRLKAMYPNIQMSVSVFCVPYFPEWSSEDNRESQLAGLNDILPHVDFLSFSVHPFMSGLFAESFPGDYLSRLFSLSTKPIAVSESSYPAQVWELAGPPLLTFNGSQEKQNNYLSLLLSESNRFNAKFVIWFTVRDYDQLWGDTLGRDQTALVWRDTGLYDESGNGRSGLSAWRAWCSRKPGE